MDKETIKQELLEDYKYLRKEIEDLKTELAISGRTTESRANGSVRHPSVAILDTYLKQIVNIVKQIKDLDPKGDMDSELTQFKEDITRR